MISIPTTDAALPPRRAAVFRLAFGGATDVGRRRASNQDRYGLFPELGLAVVADGMGGAAAGEVAAAMTVELVREAMGDAEVTWPPGLSERPAPGLPQLVAAIQRANARIFGHAQAHPRCKGMGSTVAAVSAHEDEVIVGHVGDSRVYRLRGGDLSLLTEDHTLLNALVRRGMLDPDNEKKGASHILTRAVGTCAAVEIEARLVDVSAGDTLLLCSDGLSGVVPAAEIAEILRSEHDLNEAAEYLMLEANTRGGPDNITAALVRFEVTGAAR